MRSSFIILNIYLYRFEFSLGRPQLILFFQQEKVTLSPPNPNELQIAILRTGLCGSDLHYYQHFRNGDILVQQPFALGHESAGVVKALGSAVTQFAVGDHVALEVGLPCSRCDRCREGRYNICPKLKFGSSAKLLPHPWGTLQERVNHPAEWCWKLPKGLGLDHGALLEPFSVALHALDRAELGKRESQNGLVTETQGCALVLGAGAVGALVAVALRLMEPDMEVVIADIDERRVQFAMENRFAHKSFVVPIKRGGTTTEKLKVAQDLAKLARKMLTKGGEGSDRAEELRGYDVVFECTGAEACLQSAIYTAREGGKVMMIGMGNPVQELPISAAALREVDLLGVFRYKNTYTQGTEILSEAQKDLDAGKNIPDITKLITHRIQGLGKASRAFEIASQPVDKEGRSVIKVVIEAT